MKMKIARALLYAGVIGLAIMCILGMIDNYNLAVSQGISSTISCYDQESFNSDTGEFNPTRQCDQYNPQLVFYGSIVILIIDAFLYYFFSNLITNNARTLRGFERELRDRNMQKEYGNYELNGHNAPTGQVEHKDKKLFI